MASREALEVITRGRDSSGRVIYGTRQAFQRYDRLNEMVGGKLVIIQGAMSGATASAGTHSKMGCFDYRRWNLTSAEARIVVHGGRDLGGATWERFARQGFDPHFHDICIGDEPMDDLALAQIDMYRKGFNGLGWYAHKDEDPYRPDRITPYVYLEDDMKDDERAELFRIGKRLDEFTAKEKARDKNETARDRAAAERDERRFQRLVTGLGELADDLTLLINATGDPAQKEQLTNVKRKILARLKDDPDVTGVDNPSDEAMEG